MNTQLNKVEMLIEGARVVLERAHGGLVLVSLLAANKSERQIEVDVSGDDAGEAWTGARDIIEIVTGKKPGKTATNSEIRDLADLLLKVGA